MPQKQNEQETNVSILAQKIEETEKMGRDLLFLMETFQMDTQEVVVLER